MSLLSDCTNYSSSISPSNKWKTEEKESFGLSISHPTNQMAGLCWMAVTLSVLLYAGSSFANKMSNNQLSKVVNEVWEKYSPSYKAGNVLRYPMFSLAVSIPYDEKNQKYDISQVLNTDPAENVKKIIVECKVHKSTKMVAATVLRWPNVLDQCPNEPVQWGDVLTKCNSGKSMKWTELEQKLSVINNKEESRWSNAEKQCHRAVWEGRADHAEYRTLEVFDTLVKEETNKNDFLLLYVLSSPCTDKCASETHAKSIFPFLENIPESKNRAFVFSSVFEPGQFVISADESQALLEARRKALEQLGERVGKTNIFRCVERCISCFRDNKFDSRCIE